MGKGKPRVSEYWCFFWFSIFCWFSPWGPPQRLFKYVFLFLQFFLVSPWGPPQRLFKHFLCFSMFFFSMGPSPKTLQISICCVFFQCLFWFSPWCPPQRISKYFFFQPKGLPKGQMVAMTMNVLKWTPKFGFCFWNIQCNLRIAVIFF